MSADSPPPDAADGDREFLQRIRCQAVWKFKKFCAQTADFLNHSGSYLKEGESDF